MRDISTRRIGDRTVSSLLDDLADDGEVAGGGALAAVAAAAGAAMVSMVGRTTIRRGSSADAHGRMEEIVAEADRLRVELLALADDDTEAFSSVLAALRSPKASEQQERDRHRAVQDAYRHAAEVPLAVLRRAVMLMELVHEVTVSGDAEAASEGVTGASTLFAAAVGAIASARADGAALSDAGRARSIVDETDDLRERARRFLAATEAAFEARLGASTGVGQPR